MKRSCGVIRDLLPLYAENLTCEESRKLVEEHLAECELCQNELKKLQGNEPITAEKLPLQKVERNLRKQRFQLGILVLSSVVAIMLVLFNFLTIPHYRSLEDAEITVTEVAPNIVKISSDDITTAYQVQSYFDSQGNQILELSAWDSVFNWNANRGISWILDNVSAVYYCVPGEESQLLWAKEGWEPEGHVIPLPRLALRYYLVIAGSTAVLLGVCWLIFRKKKAGPILARIFFLPASYTVSHFLIKGRNSATDTLSRDLGFIVLTALALWGICLIVYRLIQEKKQAH